MGKSKNILLEALNLFEIEVLIKTDTRFNKVDIYNELRGVKGVVVVKIEQNSYLDSKSTDRFEYSLLHIKYLVSSTPQEEIDEIKSQVMVTSKILGILQFIPRYKTSFKVEGY